MLNLRVHERGRKQQWQSVKQKGVPVTTVDYWTGRTVTPQANSYRDDDLPGWHGTRSYLEGVPVVPGDGMALITWGTWRFPEDLRETRGKSLMGSIHMGTSRPGDPSNSLAVDTMSPWDPFAETPGPMFCLSRCEYGTLLSRQGRRRRTVKGVDPS
ncbi:hypothetical protein NM208_g14383 [Fusarium decemcellulare]|uniref:Uncharacterized protein n=1 Tax=Fusarium decemcellulare TaxID=57161 RepID=A0ACC1RG84_9HYPO|nr:hypothetical protein NM208_g14383 [Fusarium decemcellulare]